MKRGTIKVLVLLLLVLGGAIVNVAVAWGFANSFGAKRHITRTYSDGLVERVSFPKDRRQGWPLPALLAEVPTPDGGAWRTTIELSNTVELACWPIWPGFAINTIFYAAMLWVVFFVPGIVKRRVRRRRGLCPACAYPVSASKVCTECGKPVKRQWAIGNGQ